MEITTYNVHFRTRSLEIDSHVAPDFSGKTLQNESAILQDLFRQIKAAKVTRDFQITHCTYLSNEGPGGARLYELSLELIHQSNTASARTLDQAMHITRWRRSSEED